MINFRVLIASFLLIPIAAALGLYRLDLNTDIAGSLPQGDKIVADGLKLFSHHPIQNRVAADIAVIPDKKGELDQEILLSCGDFLEKKMKASGLFSQVGTAQTSQLIPELALDAAKNLPFLFSADQLRQELVPLLTPQSISKRLSRLRADLAGMEGIGQADLIGLDPLGLKDFVLARLAPLAPSTDTRFQGGHLLSGDGRHLLVVATPLASSTDTAAAARIMELIQQASREFNARYRSQGLEISLTPVGAFRAGLDNELIIRHDVRLALLLATGGIGLLLLIAFPRPLIGLLSLLPALAGIALALFVYSLWNASISIMVLGFGAAIISITVDHGIAYLLFLDRRRETRGAEAANEIRRIGIMAVVTTVGAFLILSLSDFPIFTELGRFTALGVLFSFLFVHTAFPKAFPVMPAGRDRALPLRSLVDRLYATGKKGAFAAGLLALILLCFAWPRFHVSLESMNTVSEDTLAADSLFEKVWGSFGKHSFLMSEAPSPAALQEGNDRLLEAIEGDIKNQSLEQGFVPSMIFPGSIRGGRNLRAWQDFWSPQQVQQVSKALEVEGERLGFASDAFAPFMQLLTPDPAAKPPPLPTGYYNLFGISANAERPGLAQVVTLIPGERYNPSTLLGRYGHENVFFDTSLFTQRLAEILFHTFSSMLLVVAVSAALVLFFFYLNLPLTLFTLLPAGFSIVCTLGTLHLIGHPLDIPAIMLSIVILGMGIDYSIFCVRAHQRYRDTNHPSFTLVRSAVFLAGTSTLIGFGALCFAHHSLLRSIGITSFLGIGYSLIGTFFLLPPLLTRYFDPQRQPPKAENTEARVRRRYRLLEAYPRLFARFKLRTDPLFGDIDKLISPGRKAQKIIDIGCGYGVPGCWLLERYPDASLHGIDPDSERVRVASLASADRGQIVQGAAPDVPLGADGADLVLLLDMLHYLDDKTAAQLFRNSYAALVPGGRALIRVTLRPHENPSWTWHFENSRNRLRGQRTWYRTGEEMAALLATAGFSVIYREVPEANAELIWMVGQKGQG